MREHHVPDSHCLECHAVIDMAGGIRTEDAPSPGDISLCLYCGHVMIYGENLGLREPTDSEIVEIADNPELVLASNAIAAIKKRVGEPSRTANNKEDE